MYAKVENNIVIEYPVSELQIRSEFPHVSFPTPFYPVEPYYIVHPTTADVVDSTKKVEEDTPVLFNGFWKQKWKISDVENYEEVLAERKRIKLEEIANMRWEYQQRGVQFKDQIFKTDEVSRMQYILAAAINSPVQAWKVREGVFVSLTGEEIKQLNDTVWLHIQNGFQVEQIATGIVQECTTIEEVDAFDITSRFS